MEDLLASDALGGSAVAGPAASKLLDKECKKNACCPSLSLKTRFIVFGCCWSLGKFIYSVLYLFRTFLGNHFHFCWISDKICDCLHNWNNVNHRRVIFPMGTLQSD